MESPNRIENRNSGTKTAMWPSEVKPSNCSPQPHWNTATIRPYAAPTESRFIAIACNGSTSGSGACEQASHAGRTGIRQLFTLFATNLYVWLTLGATSVANRDVGLTLRRLVTSYFGNT